jgi:hypothetical protein
MDLARGGVASGATLDLDFIRVVTIGHICPSSGVSSDPVAAELLYICVKG